MRTKKVEEPVILEEIHSSGRCIGRHKGKNLYISYGIPGETVEIELSAKRMGFWGGQVTRVISPSPHRLLPFCKHAGPCGGCNWQHMDYSLQLDLKRQILVNALQKYEIPVPDIPPVIPAPETTHFRHRMEYTFSETGWQEEGSPSAPHPALGFHLNGEPNQVVHIEECYLQQEPAREICESVYHYALGQKMPFYNHREKTGLLRSLSIRITLSGEILVLVGFAEDQPALRESLMNHLAGTFPAITSLCYTIHPSGEHSQMQGEIIPWDPSGVFIHEHLNGFTFRMHASSFFQPNPAQAENIFALARTWAALTGRENVADLYTGVGTIALHLAPEAKAVLGIEGSPAAIADANENARLNGIRNARFMVGDILQTFTQAFLDKQEPFDLVALDPPRSGTLIEIKKTILASGAAKVLYLSCNPVSLAFDLKQLTAKYRVTKIQPFDMLPHTHQLETLVLLEREI